MDNYKSFSSSVRKLVEKPVPVPPVDPEDGPATVVGTTRPKPSGEAPADMAGKLIDEKSAEQFQDELDKEVIEHG